jgi:hypothetical protein
VFSDRQRADLAQRAESLDEADGQWLELRFTVDGA